jgi:hypothetical protein
MHRGSTLSLCLLFTGLSWFGPTDAATAQDSKLQRLKYNHPGLAWIPIAPDLPKAFAAREGASQS